MRHLKTYRIFENSPTGVTVDQSLWLNKVCIGSWKMNDQGAIDVKGSVEIKDDAGITPEGENFHGLKFGRIDGYFECGESTGITHLRGTPREVNGSFYIKRSQLKNLEGGPVKVSTSYQVLECGLESLEGCPKLADTLDVEFNQLKNLKGAEDSRIRIMMIGFNRINSLEGLPKDLEDIKGRNNPVSSETLSMILASMDANPEMPYGAVLASLESRIPERDWKILDKSAMESISAERRRGYKLLGGIGGI